MEEQNNSEKRAMNESEFMRYATKRVVVIVAIVLVVMWAFVKVVGFLTNRILSRRPTKQPMAPKALSPNLCLPILSRRQRQNRQQK